MTSITIEQLWQLRELTQKLAAGLSEQAVASSKVAQTALELAVLVQSLGRPEIAQP